MLNKLGLYVGVLCLMILSTACSTKSDLEAFKEAKYSLEKVDQIRVNGINVSDKKRTEDFSFSEAAILFSAFSENKLNATSTLNLKVELGEEHKDRTMKLTQLKWQMLVNDERALSGIVSDSIELKNGLNVITVSSPLALAQENGGASLNNLLRMATLVHQSKAQVKLQIKPTIQTSVGPLELPAFISIN